MSREIWFRAKRTDNGKWIYGDLLTPSEFVYLFEISERKGNGLRFEINPNTIGQWTGLRDWNGWEIFEGDILGEWAENEKGEECLGYIGVVTYWEREGRYVLTDKNGHCNDWTLEDEAKPENWDKLLIIGNIYDNPELLEDEE